MGTGGGVLPGIPYAAYHSTPFRFNVIPFEPYLKLFTEEDKKPSEAVLKEKFELKYQFKIQIHQQ